MNKRKLTGFILILLFILVTGFIFLFDFESSNQAASGSSDFILQADSDSQAGDNSQAGSASDSDDKSDTGSASQADDKSDAGSVSQADNKSGSGTDSQTSDNSQKDSDSKSGSDSENSSDSETDETRDLIYVYVCGQVKKAGVYKLDRGARIYEAVDAAGGLTKDAQPEQLNLAQTLNDGDKVYVPAQGEEVSDAVSGNSVSGSSGSSSGSSGSASSQSGLVNLNTATAEQLQTLPGIGESKAADIISYRESNGGFKSKDELMNIAGIKEGVYGKIESLITVE